MLESLVTDYGYPVLVLGTFLEGETILILGGLVAHLGYLSLGWVILSGFCGSLLGCQVWFFIGRYQGKALLARHPRWQQRVDVVLRRLERRQNLVIAGFPFLYGFRTVTPLAIGMSDVSYWRFLLLNVVGEAAWAVGIACAGFFFGRGLEAILGDVKRYELAVIGSVVAIAAIVWGGHFYRRRRET
jgi:membrane protein DedA with SNARE-associated domain